MVAIYSARAAKHQSFWNRLAWRNRIGKMSAAFCDLEPRELIRIRAFYRIGALFCHDVCRSGYGCTRMGFNSIHRPGTLGWEQWAFGVRCAVDRACGHEAH